MSLFGQGERRSSGGSTSFSQSGTGRPGPLVVTGMGQTASPSSPSKAPTAPVSPKGRTGPPLAATATLTTTTTAPAGGSSSPALTMMTANGGMTPPLSMSGRSRLSSSASQASVSSLTSFNGSTMSLTAATTAATTKALVTGPNGGARKGQLDDHMEDRDQNMDDDNNDDALDDASFVTAPAGPLICKIHNGVMRDPVIAKCGYSFCRACLARKIHQTGKCPITDMPLTEADMWPNLALLEQIGELVAYCRYRKQTPSDLAGGDVEGCQIQIKLKDKRQHEATCGFAPVKCPNSVECGPLLATQVEAHLLVCANVPCPHIKRGCIFRGMADQVKQHLETCKYEALKDLLNERDKRVDTLEDMLTERNEELVEMKRAIQQLNARIEELEKTVIGAFQEKLDSLARSMRDYGMHVTDLTSDVSHLNAKVGLVDDIDLYNHKFKCVGTYIGHTGPVWALALSGDLIFSGSSDLTIKAWDINRRVCVQTMSGHEGIIYAVAIIGRTLYSGSSDCTIKMWSLTTYELLKSVSPSENTVCTLAVRNSERPLLLSGSLKTVTVWDAEQLTVITNLKGHNHWVRALAVAGDRLYSGSYNMIMIWELEGFQCIRTITCQGGSVYSLAVDIVGQNLISGIYENRIDLWDLHTFQQKGSLIGHTATVYALAMSSAGPNRLFSGSYDNTVKVWNLETFQCVQTLIRHTSSVAAVIYGKGKIFSAAADNQIKVWG